jgi:rSAM/selenodomain-associated transferase 1
MTALRSSAGRRVLAIMAKAPRPGHVKTRLNGHYAPQAVVALYRCLLADTISLATRLPDVALITVCPPGDLEEMRSSLPGGIELVAQRGSGLADGLHDVFDRFAEPGGRAVVALDSDSPHVPAAEVQRAFDLLERFDVTAGPTVDGGYYLVGATRAYPGLFDRERMGTRTALQSLLDRVHDLGLTIGFTAESYDVDEPADVARLDEVLRTHPERAPETARLLALWREPCE